MYILRIVCVRTNCILCVRILYISFIMCMTNYPYCTYIARGVRRLWYISYSVYIVHMYLPCMVRIVSWNRTPDKKVLLVGEGTNLTGLPPLSRRVVRINPNKTGWEVGGGK